MTAQIGRPVGRGPRAADFLAHLRGGGLLTVAVNQRIGAGLCVLAHLLRLPPSVLTLCSLATGVGGSALLIGAGTPRPQGPIYAGVGAFLLWQLSYCLDCADGQLARQTGTTSDAGARLDVMCDVAVHTSVVIAMSMSAVRHVPAAPTWLLAAFACAVLTNLCVSVLVPSGAAAGSLFTDNSRPVVRAGSLVFDYPVFLTAYTCVLVAVPDRLDLFLIAVVLVNLLLLLVRIVKATDVSLRQQLAAESAAPTRAEAG
jgi:phosphatidylglycerophosphate synthase